MNTKLKDLAGAVALKFPEESERWHKEVARKLCKSHKLSFSIVMAEVKTAVNQQKHSVQIEVKVIDDLVRERLDRKVWDWAIINTRDNLIKVMTRFGYEISMDSGLIIIVWERGKHHDYSEESK